MQIFQKVISLLGVLSPVHITWFTLMKGGEPVGKDQYGNAYYEADPRPGYKNPRRWVVYKGSPDASSVPPQWHGWLHHQTDAIPRDDDMANRAVWQKPHVPNMTGTDRSYRPPGHVLRSGKRDKATGDYTPWIPSQ